MDWEKIKASFLKLCKDNDTKPSSELILQLKFGFDLLEGQLRIGVNDSEFSAILESSIINMLSSLSATLEQNNALTSVESTEYAIDELLDNIVWFIAKSYIIPQNITLETLSNVHQDIAQQLNKKINKITAVAQESLNSLESFAGSIHKQIQIEFEGLKISAHQEIKKKINTTSLSSGEKEEFISNIEALLTSMTQSLAEINIETIEDLIRGIQQLSEIPEEFEYNKTKELQRLVLLANLLVEVQLKHLQYAHINITDEFLHPKLIAKLGENLSKKLQLPNNILEAINELGLGKITQSSADDFLKSIKEKFSYNEEFDIKLWDSLISSPMIMKFKDKTATLTYEEQLSFFEFIPDIIDLLKHSKAKSLGEIYSSDANLIEFATAVINARPAISLQNQPQLFTIGKKLFKDENILKLLLPAIIGLALRYESDFRYTSITKDEIRIIGNYEVASAFKIDDDILSELQEALILLLRFKTFNKTESKDTYESLRLFGIPEMSKKELLNFISKYQESEDQELRNAIIVCNSIVDYLERQNIQEFVKDKNIAELEETLLEVNDKYAILFKKMIDYNNEITKREIPKTAAEEKHLEKCIIKLCLYKEVMNLVKSSIESHTAPAPIRKDRSKSL